MVNPFLPFVGLDTVRALTLYTVLRPGWNVSSTSINMWAEALKVAVSAVLLAYHNIPILPAESDRTPGQLSVALKVLAFAAPAALFGANNAMYAIGLQVTTPGRLATAMTARLPFSAILHHFAISPQRDWRAWLSLLCLMLGLALSQYSPSSKSSLDPQSMADVAEQKGAFIGSILGLTIAAISAIAGVTTEKILKDPSTPFWRSQLWLYWWGFVFAGAGALAWDGNVAVHEQASVAGPSASVAFALTILCASLSAGTGLLAGAVLSTLDIVWKLLGNALTLVTVSVGTALFFPHLEMAKLSSFFILGAGVILISSWHYAYHTGGLKGSSHASQIEPTFTRTCFFGTAVIFMATVAASIEKQALAKAQASFVMP